MQTIRYDALMICRIEGKLVAAQDGRVELACGALTYELMVPAVEQQPLSEALGTRVEFYTLHVLESQGQGAVYVPRLFGFRSAQQRAFFELLTTVKGLGSRKALRAMRLPHQVIAQAIAAKDVQLLTSLPEIGKRRSETIVAQLNGKMDGFLELKPSASSTDPDPSAEPSSSAMIGDALAALCQLGESNPEAHRLIERALAADPSLDSADALVSAAYRLKEPA